jgi:5-methylcytosine-specific restriction endonuclease McrA
VWERRRLVRQWNLDQSELRFRGRLPAVEGRVFDAAIDSRVDAMGPNPETGMFDPVETRSADVLVELAASRDDGGGDGAIPQMTVFADLDALTTRNQGWAELDNTAPVSNETARRLGCDAIVEWVISRDGQPIGIGRKSRKIPGWLRRLVYHRDGSQCQHPGCGNTRWLQVHHIIPWAHGGPTDLDNLILLCGIHHRWVHENGWHITGPPHARLFRRPDRTPYPHPRPQLDPRLTEMVSM